MTSLAFPPAPGGPTGTGASGGWGAARPAGHACPGLERCRHVGTFYLRPRRSSGLALDLSSVVDIVHCCPPPHPSAVRIRTDTPASGPASPSAGAHSDPSPSPQGLGCEFCLGGGRSPTPEPRDNGEPGPEKGLGEWEAGGRRVSVLDTRGGQCWPESAPPRRASFSDTRSLQV